MGVSKKRPLSWDDSLFHAVFMRHTKEVVVCLDLDGVIQAINPAAELFYGWEKQTVCGRNYVHACAHSGVPLVLPEDYCHVLKEVGVYVTKTQHIVNGLCSTCIWTVLPLPDVETMQGVMLIGRILLGNTIKSALPEVIEMLPGQFYWKDMMGRYQAANTAFLRALHMQKKELIGKVDDELWACAEQVQAIRRHDKWVIEKGESITVEEAITLKTGQVKQCVVTKSPLVGNDNQIIGIMGVAVDVTPQKQAEMRAKSQLSMIMNVVPGNLYWKSKEGIYLDCNRFMIDIAGKQNKAEIIGKTDEALWPSQANQLKENDSKVIQSGQSMSLEEYIDLPDGRHYFAAVKEPLRDCQGHIVGVVGNSMDITQLKHYQEQLQQEKEKVEQAYQVKKAFLYNMRHDIRTPFTGLLGLAESLALTEPEPERKAQLQYLAQSAHALLRIMNEILDYLEQDTVSPGLIIKKFSLKELVNTLDDALLSAARHKNLKWYVHYDADIPDLLFGDKLALYRFLMNLLCNAVKFTEEGYVRLKIDLLFREKKRVFIRFVIEDSGSGIPDDKVDFIFESFTRVTPSYEGRYSGIGLGLRFVKQFMDEIEDAEIEVDSQLGVGSTFTCTIPFKIPLSERFRRKQYAAAVSA